MVVYLRMGWHLHLRMRVEVLSGVLGLVLGVCVCSMLYCPQPRLQSKFSKKSQSCCFSVFFAIKGSKQGAMQGAIQGLANVFLTLKSVRAQWRVIIGVRIYLAWSVGVICCHGKRRDSEGFSARS